MTRLRSSFVLDLSLPLSLPLTLPLALSLALALSAPAAAQVSIPRGLAVVTDEVTLDRTATMIPGQVLSLKVVVTEPDAVVGDGWRGAQFGVDVDPRLQVLGKIPAFEAFFSQEVAPDEWVISLNDCIAGGRMPFVLMTYVVQLPVGATSTSDLRVDLRDLTQYGERILLAHCVDSAFLEPAADLGGVSLNPTAPSITHFSSSEPTLVEGRDLWLAWSTVGSSDVRLDGVSVSGEGTTLRSPANATTYVISASDGVTTRSDTTSVQVIRRPRVDFFTVEPASGVPGSVRLSWSVTGAVGVELEGAGSQWPIAGTLLTMDTGPTWTLRATNEWGTTTAFATSGATTSPPVIGTFVAQPNPYYLGEPLTLTYSVFGADTVDIDQGVGSVDPVGGDVVVTPNGELPYTLTATNAHGSSTTTLWVVPNAPKIELFEFDSPVAVLGSFARLRWRIRGATEATVSPDIGTVAPDSGVVSVHVNGSGNFILTASNAWGASAATAHLSAVPGAIRFLRVVPQSIYPGEPVEVVWSAETGFSLSMDPDIGPITVSEGSRFVVPPADSTVYTLTAANADTAISVSAPPVVWKRPLAELRLPASTPLLFQVPYPVEVFLEGADAATLEPGFGAIDPSGGVFEFSLSDSTQITLTATNAAGTTTVSHLLVPDTRAPQIQLELVTQPTAVGQPFDIRVVAQSAESITVTPFIGDIDPSGGTYTTSIVRPTTYVATATNRVGTAVDSLEVTVPGLEPVVTLSASPLPAFSGRPLELTVSTLRADSLVLEPGFGAVDPAGGVFTTSITDSTVFTATAYNVFGQSSAQLGVGIESRLPTASVSVLPDTSPFAGQPVQLQTVVARADSAWVEPTTLGLTITNGTELHGVAFDDTTRVTLHAQNPNGSVTSEVVVTPLPPTAQLSGPVAVSSGSPAVLTVVVEGATSVTLLPGFGNISGSGNYSAIVRDPTTFVLTATNPLGTATATHHVAIDRPSIELFAASTNEALVDEPVTLSWQVAGADSILISDGRGFELRSLDRSGTVVVTESVDRSYQLTAFGLNDEVSPLVDVVRVPLRIESFTADPSVISPGFSSTLSWRVVGDAQVDLDAVGVVDSVGTLVVSPQTTTVYTLTAFSGSFVRQAQATVSVASPSTAAIELSWATYTVPGTPQPIHPFIPFTFYVVATDVPDGMFAYEFGLDLSSNLIVLSAVVPYPNAVNVGSGHDWIVGAGDCVQPAAIRTLLEVTVLPIETAGELFIRLRGSVPSSFANGEPGYYSCTRLLRNFQTGGPLDFFGGGGGGVPVISVAASAVASSDGVWIEWSAPPEIRAQAVHVMRTRKDETPRLVATLEGATSGRWLDPEGPNRADGEIFYRVIVRADAETYLSPEVAVESDGTPPIVAQRSRLLPNVPNPFNPSTDLRFELSRTGDARLDIYDAAGRHVWNWQRRGLASGLHTTTWLGHDDQGRSVSSGVYLVQLSTSDGVDTQRIVLVK